MKTTRRKFIAEVGGAVLSASVISSASGQEPGPRPSGRFAARRLSENAVLENSALRLEIDGSTGAFCVIDKTANERWTSDPWQNTAGILTLERPKGERRDFLLSAAEEITVERKGAAAAEIRFRRFPPVEDQGVVEATVRTRLSLTGDNAFRVEVLEIDHPSQWRLVELEYPCRFGGLKTDVDHGYTVIPYWQGSIIPSICGTFEKRPRVALWAWDDYPWREPGIADLTVYGWHGISMPFFGAVNRRGAWCAVFDTEADGALRCVINSNYQLKFDLKGKASPYCRMAVNSPLWLSVFGEFEYPRSMTYYFLPDGDYATIAKQYRAIAKDRGLLVTLREKIDKNPNIDTIVGGPLINFGGPYPWYIDYPAYAFTWKDVRERIDSLIAESGLQRALMCLWGGYQNYPPNSYPFHPGYGTVDELRELVQYAKTRNVLICFYHGYPALLDHDPQFDIRRSVWINPEGSIKTRWGRHCSKFFLQYARKNLPLSVRDSGQVADYTDMLTASPIEECWAPDHRHTRAEDIRDKSKLLQYINSLGLFTGSESIRGWAVPHMAYAKGAHASAGNALLNAFQVPLFNLVYHDALMAYGAGNATQLALGSHTMSTDKSILAWSQEFSRDTGLEELVSHEFADDFNGPFSARYSNGTLARVNNTPEPREIEGETVEANTIAIAYGDGRRRMAPG